MDRDEFISSLLSDMPPPPIERVNNTHELYEVQTLLPPLKIKLEVFKENFEITEPSGLRVRWELKRIANFIHDYTVLPLTKNTDKPLSEIYTLKDPDDNLTPDDIITIMDKTFVIEYATTRSLNENTLISAFAFKYSKYRVPLLNRQRASKKLIRYGVLIIGRNLIISNLNLKQRLINQLSQRLRTAEEILNMLKDQYGLDISQDEIYSDSRDKKEAKILLSAMKLNERSYTKDFTPDLYGSSYTSYDPGYIQQSLKQHFLRAQETTEAERDKGKPAKDKIHEVEKKMDKYFESIISNPHGTSLTKKTICNIPLILPHADHHDKNACNIEVGIRREHTDSEINETSKLWVSSLTSRIIGDSAGRKTKEERLREEIEMS